MPGRGLIAPDPARRLVRAPAADHHVVRGALATLKGEADLSPSAPKVLNQGQSETCALHSAMTMLFTRTQIVTGTAVLQSPLYAAQVVYAIYRAAQYPKSFPKGDMGALHDTGAQLDDVDAALGKWGTIRFQTPQQDGETDVPATDADGIGIPELTEDEAQAGASALLSGPYDIPIDGNIGDTVAACLDSAIPVWIRRPRQPGTRQPQGGADRGAGAEHGPRARAWRHRLPDGIPSTGRCGVAIGFGTAGAPGGVTLGTRGPRRTCSRRSGPPCRSG